MYHVLITFSCPSLSRARAAVKAVGSTTDNAFPSSTLTTFCARGGKRGRNNHGDIGQRGMLPTYNISCSAVSFISALILTTGNTSQVYVGNRNCTTFGIPLEMMRPTARQTAAKGKYRKEVRRCCCLRKVRHLRCPIGLGMPPTTISTPLILPLPGFISHTCKPAAASLSDIGRTLTATLTASLSLCRDLAQFACRTRHGGGESWRPHRITDSKTGGWTIVCIRFHIEQNS